jgi:hypothetical protein
MESYRARRLNLYSNQQNQYNNERSEDTNILNNQSRKNNYYKQQYFETKIIKEIIIINNEINFPHLVINNEKNTELNTKLDHSNKLCWSTMVKTDIDKPICNFVKKPIKSNIDFKLDNNNKVTDDELDDMVDKIKLPDKLPDKNDLILLDSLHNTKCKIKKERKKKIIEIEDGWFQIGNIKKN